MAACGASADLRPAIFIDFSRSADQVRAAYVKAMGDTVHTLFKAYHTALAKLDLEVANKNDTIAVDESAIRLAFSTKVSMTKRGDVFALGERAAVLGAIDDAPIFVHIAQAEGAKYPFEVRLMIAIAPNTNARSHAHVRCLVLRSSSAR